MAKGGKNKARGTPASQGAAGKDQSRNLSHEDGATAESWSTVAARGHKNRNPAAHRGQTPVTNGGSSGTGSKADKPENDSSSSGSSDSSGDDDSSSDEEETEEK